MPTFTVDTRPGSEHAIVGVAEKGIGVFGRSDKSTGTGGKSDSGVGVHGVSNAGPGVRGDAENGDGVFGFSETHIGVHGMTDSGSGVIGTSEKGVGVWGRSNDSSGVGGKSINGIGVHGVSREGPGVRGDADNRAGVLGFSKTAIGIHGVSETGEGIHGETASPTVAAIAAFNLNPEGTGAALFGKKEGSKGHAGFFVGNVHIAGNLTTDGDIFLQNADCAEDFDIAGANSVEPGTVMVLGDDHALTECHKPYDKRVAGVVSGAGDHKPGIVLDKRRSSRKRQPIALLGKAFCKVDAQFGAIETGDLLTTSSTPGHAMKASDQLKAFGAVIGKALRPLMDGRGMIPILVALQ